MVKPVKPVLKLVSINTKFKSNREPFEWENPRQVCQLLKGEIISAMKAGTSASQIAQKCCLSTSTVAKLGYGETKQPRASTCLVLLKYFGFKVLIS
jgi:hypothetical protein